MVALYLSEQAATAYVSTTVCPTGRARHGRRRTAANTAQQKINLCGGGVPFSHLPCVLCFFLTFPYSLIDRLAPLRATAYATSVSCPPLGMFVRAN